VLLSAAAAAAANSTAIANPFLTFSYIVLNRPYALLQWVKAVTIPEK